MISQHFGVEKKGIFLDKWKFRASASKWWTLWFFFMGFLGYAYSRFWTMHHVSKKVPLLSLRSVSQHPWSDIGTNISVNQLSGGSLSLKPKHDNWLSQEVHYMCYLIVPRHLHAVITRLSIYTVHAVTKFSKNVTYLTLYSMSKQWGINVKINVLITSSPLESNCYNCKDNLYPSHLTIYTHITRKSYQTKTSSQVVRQFMFVY